MQVISGYYDESRVAAAVANGEHREIIGGLWNEIGDLQINFLQDNGLTPDKTLLDIGCGSLRLGVRAVRYLDKGNYWGTDLNEKLLNAGYDKEIIPQGLADKLSRSHLIVDEDFTFTSVPHDVNFAIAQSVFTHLPFNHMRLCLTKLAQHVTSACTFFFTTFVPRGAVTESHLHEKGGVITHPHRDPYHYSLADLFYAAAETPWSIEFIGDWNHSRDQLMVKATKS